MILVTKNNVSEKLLTMIVGNSGEDKFLLQTSKGIHTARLCARMGSTTQFMVKHIPNSPYAVIRKGSSSTYVSGSLHALANPSKHEDYDFYMRRQSP